MPGEDIGDRRPDHAFERVRHEALLIDGVSAKSTRSTALCGQRRSCSDAMTRVAPWATRSSAGLLDVTPTTRPTPAARAEIMPTVVSSTAAVASAVVPSAFSPARYGAGSGLPSV